MSVPWELDREPFIHERLRLGGNSIRLVTLYPSQDEYSFIACDITQYPTHRQPEYVALSYMWGPEDEKFEIILNGKKFEIRRNLYDCLIQFRKQADEPLTLWIDAMCIDQTNNAERSHIVQLMDQIYERAKEVYVWLGPGDESSDTAIKFLADVHRDIRMREDQYDAFLDLYMLPSQYYEQWLAVVRLFKRDYWSRLWIIQETLLATSLELFCGGLRIPWKQVEHVVSLVKQSIGHFDRRRSGRSELHDAIINKTTAANIFLRRFDSTRFSGHRNTFPTLQHHLESFKDCQCFDARDEIFGLLSIASDFYDRRNDYIDYNLRNSEVFIRFLQDSIANANDVSQLETLYNVRRLSDALRLDVVNITRRRTKSILKTEASYLDLTSTENSVKLSMPCTTILKFSNENDDDLHPSVRPGILARELGLTESHSRSANGSTSSVNSSNFSLDSDQYSHLRDLAHYKRDQICDAFAETQDDMTLVSTHSRSSSSSTSLGTSSSSYRCFTIPTPTTTGHGRSSSQPCYGIACPSARPGDLLVKCRESRLAFIARKVKDEAEVYDIVGTALIHKECTRTKTISSSIRKFLHRSDELSSDEDEKEEVIDATEDQSGTIQARFNPQMLLMIVCQRNWRKNHMNRLNNMKIVQRQPSNYTAIQPRGDDDPVLKSFGHRRFIGSTHIDRAANQFKDWIAIELEAVRDRAGSD